MQKSLYVSLEVSKFTKVNQDILHQAEVKKSSAKIVTTTLKRCPTKNPYGFNERGVVTLRANSGKFKWL